MIEFIFLFMTSYLIFYDAKKLQGYNEGIYLREIRFTPFGLSIGSLLLFIFFAPFYLIKRNKYLDAIKLDEETWKKIEADDIFKETANLTKILIMFLISTSVLSVFFLILAFALPPMQDTLFQGVIFGVLSNIVFIFLIIYFLKNKDNINLLSYLHINKTSNLVLMSIVIPVIGGLLFAALSFVVTSSYFSSFSSTSPMSNALLQGTTAGKVTFILFAILIAPFLEEIIFRGYLFTTISRVKGDQFAVAFVGLLFASMHVDQNWGDIVVVMLVFMVGLFLTLLRFHTKSVIPSIVSHYSYNIALLILPSLFMSFYNPSYLQFIKNQETMQFEEKEMLLLNSIEEKPEFADAYNALAWMYAENEKRLDQGLFLIDKAIELKPDDLHYMDTKAEILFKMKRYDEAIGIEKSLIEKIPGFMFFKEQLEKFEKAKAEEKKHHPG
jgi:uncharacterized protein